LSHRPLVLVAFFYDNYFDDIVKSTRYLFQSERLGFRTWNDEDLDEFANMNADPEVMRHFPSTLSRDETAHFIHRLQAHFTEHGYAYFVVETLFDRTFIGFIGLAYQTYETTFTPAVDIGWRLVPSAWGKGYATEGAQRVLEYGFDTIGLKSIIATCTIQNTKSERVMRKIGMRKLTLFDHPRLVDFPDYVKCIAYRIESDEWKAENT